MDDEAKFFETAAQNELDLRYAMRLLWHAHHALEQVDLTDPDPFQIQCAMQYLRLAQGHLPDAWAHVEQEIAAKARRGPENNHGG